MATVAQVSVSARETRGVKEHRCFLPFAAASICALFVVAGLGVWLVTATLHRKEQPTHGPAEKSVNCLTHTLNELANYINTEGNPCTNFHEYVCNKSGHLDARDAVRLKFSKEIINPILQGRFKDEKSQLLSAHYSSCVETAAIGKVSFEEVTQNMFKMFRSQADIDNDSDVIAVIGMLCIQLGLKVPLYVQAEVDKEDGYAYVVLGPADPGSTPDLFYARKTREIVKHFVTAVQTKIQAKFTMESLRKFYHLATDLEDEDSEGFLKGNLSVLDALSPSFNFDQWKPYLLEIFVSWAGKIQGASEDLHVELRGPSKVRKLLQLYALPGKRFTALAYLAFLSIYQFFREEIRLEARTKSAAECAAMCMKTIMPYRFLWASIAVERLRQPQHDAFIVDLYKIIIGSAMTEMDAITEEVYSRNLSTFDYKGHISSLQLVLPGNLTSAYLQQLPNLTRDYWSNVFLMRQLQWKAELVDIVRGFASLDSFLKDVFAHPVVFYGSNVMFSPTVYSLLNTQCQDQKERRVLDALTMGVTIADHLFQWLFNSVWDSSDRGHQLVKNWIACHRQAADAAHFQDPMIAYPWLSVRVAQRMAELYWWDGVVMHWSTWAVRPAQIFYALFYSRNMCDRVTRTAVLNTASMRMHALPGFSAAFQCPGLPVLSRDLCLVTATLIGR